MYGGYAARVAPVKENHLLVQPARQQGQCLQESPGPCNLSGQAWKSPGHGSWGCESCVGMSWLFISWRICLMVSSIRGKNPVALDENVALEGILCWTFIAALCPRGAWLKHECSHVCLAGYVGHVIPCVRVCKAGQYHLVVIASQHHVDGQFHLIAHNSVFRCRSWLVFLGNVKTMERAANAGVTILGRYEGQAQLR